MREPNEQEMKTAGERGRWEAFLDFLGRYWWQWPLVAIAIYMPIVFWAARKLSEIQPSWAVVQGVLTLVLTSVAIHIAWRQHVNARHKLRMDLYDKRFEVYQAIVTYIERVARDVPDFQYEESSRVEAQIAPMSFLYGPEVRAFVRRLLDDADNQIGERSGSGECLTPEAYSEWRDRLASQRAEMLRRLERFNAVVAPYLRLDRIK